MLQLLCVLKGASLHIKKVFSGSIAHFVFVIFNDTYCHVFMVENRYVERKKRQIKLIIILDSLAVYLIFVM